MQYWLLPDAVQVTFVVQPLYPGELQVTLAPIEALVELEENVDPIKVPLITTLLAGGKAEPTTKPPPPLIELPTSVTSDRAMVQMIEGA